MASVIRLTLHGDEVLYARLANAPQKVQRAAGEGLRAAGEKILDEAGERTPVDTGRLKGSRAMVGPTGSGNKIEVVLQYGTTYAIYVHERLELNHPVGQAKFLESAVIDGVDTFIEEMNKALRSAI